MKTSSTGKKAARSRPLHKAMVQSKKPVVAASKKTKRPAAKALEVAEAYAPHFETETHRPASPPAWP